MFASKDIFLKSSGGYQISRSVRLRSSAGGYFSRTPATTTNRKTFTYSLWVKRGILSASGTYELMNCGTKTVSQVISQFNITGDKLSFETSTYGVSNFIVGTTAAVFRDPSAWYHIVFSIDTTQATNSNGVRIYVNGVQQTLTFSAYTQNYDTAINTNSLTDIGQNRIGTDYFDGYLTEINFIDGQALTPSSFGQTNSVTGVWQPIKYTGTYGTNGFYLNFSDNSNNTATTIGKDYSGNGNNWTPSAGISITAGVTYDSMLDVPTPYADGGNGRGNYAVMNPLNNTGTLSNANLTFTGTDKAVLSTIAIPTSGKYYFEATCTTVANFSTIGIANVSSQASSFNGVIASANFRTYNSGGEKADSTRTAGWGSTFTSGDVIGVAVDMDNGAIYFAKNNTWQASGVPTSGASKTGAAFTDLTSSGITWTAFFSAQNSSGVWSPTFGQRPFSYTPPTGFVALNTQNLPAPTISNGATVMAATTYTGTGSAMSVSNAVNNVSFQPDWVWIKQRNNAANHVLADAIRGVDKYVFSNLTNAEATATAGTGITAFNSNGFSLGTETSTVGSVNAAGGTGTYVAWQWNAGGSTVTNTNGSISAQVRANPTAGFSVVTYTGTGANATVGHGLGVAPSMIIVKNRGVTDVWMVQHASLGPTKFIILNRTDAEATLSTVWNNTSPTSSVFSIGTLGDVNRSTNTYVAYCFAPVAGYSAFGKYTGNGSTDGPFVFTNFRPRWVMIKRTDTAGENWEMWDSSRGAYNIDTPLLYANLSNAETAGSAARFDALSNGFKIRSTNAGVNASGGTYVYAAFCENPFKLSLAR